MGNCCGGGQDSDDDRNNTNLRNNGGRQYGSQAQSGGPMISQPSAVICLNIYIINFWNNV
jgi:hypothetical protein